MIGYDLNLCDLQEDRITQDKNPGPQGDFFTPDDQFKTRVMDLINEHTQQVAMQIAAQEREVELLPSYYDHPGSHINRWRQQGF